MEGEAVIRGNGSNMPTGMLNDVPQARADFDSPYRDADEYEYLNADSDSPFAVSGDGLIDLLYRVASQYRTNGSWVMNSATLAEVRKLKSTDGVYLWAPGLAPGQPASLLGYPVQTWEQMDNVDVSGGSNPSFPIAFGDFRRGYVLCDRTGLRITTDDNITKSGFHPLLHQTPCRRHRLQQRCDQVDQDCCVVELLPVNLRFTGACRGGPCPKGSPLFPTGETMSYSYLRSAIERAADRLDYAQKEHSRFAATCDRRNELDLRRLRKLEQDIDRAKSDLRWAERQLAELGSAEAILP